MREHYEFFDFEYKKSIGIDFKHWKDNPKDTQRETELEKITNKMSVCSYKKAIIANVLSKEESLSSAEVLGNILLIPALVDSKTGDLIIENIRAIKEFLQ